MSKHTLAPWAVSYDKNINNEDERYAVMAGGLYIAGLYASGTSASDYTSEEAEREVEANARLIAAAPDLLSLALDYRGAIEFQIRLDLKKGDTEGANLKRLTLQYVEGIIAKASSNEQ